MKMKVNKIFILNSILLFCFCAEISALKFNENRRNSLEDKFLENHQLNNLIKDEERKLENIKRNRNMDELQLQTSENIRKKRFLPSLFLENVRNVLFKHHQSNIIKKHPPTGLLLKPSLLKIILPTISKIAHDAHKVRRKKVILSCLPFLRSKFI